MTPIDFECVFTHSFSANEHVGMFASRRFICGHGPIGQFSAVIELKITLKRQVFCLFKCVVVGSRTLCMFFIIIFFLIVFSKKKKILSFDEKTCLRSRVISSLVKVCLENDWNSKANDFLILARRAAIPLKTTRHSLGTQMKSKQRSPLFSRAG